MIHLEEYYYRLSQGDRTNLARVFRGVPLISDPRFGDVLDWPGFEAYVSESTAWLSERKAVFSPCEKTRGLARSVLEGRLTLASKDPAGLVLVALVCNAFAGGIQRLHIYHASLSADPRRRRRAVLPPNPTLLLPDAPAHFIRALAEARPDQARQAFSADARLYAPSASSLEEYLGWLDGAEPRVWQLCTLTSEGYRHVIEYNLTPPEDIQPAPGGCAVFELEAGGTIQRLRLYPA